MKQTELKNVKKGDYFVLTPNVKFEGDTPFGEVKSKYVRVRGDYCRKLKMFEVYKFDDVNDCRFMRGDRIVYVDFMF